MDADSVEFGKHMLEKMRARHVDEQQVVETIKDSESSFEDVESNALVTVKRLESESYCGLFANELWSQDGHAVLRLRC